jgi:hypothetical protein
LRPADLLAARSETDPTKLQALEGCHILRVLQKQKKSGASRGFQILTDGELRSLQLLPRSGVARVGQYDRSHWYVEGGYDTIAGKLFSSN